jgi:hypothetical protein
MQADPIQQSSADFPLALIPGGLSWHHGPGHRQDPRMHQPSQLAKRQVVPKGRLVQHQVQPLSTQWRQDLLPQELPDQRHQHTLSGNEACQAPLSAAQLRFTEPALDCRFRPRVA